MGFSLLAKDLFQTKDKFGIVVTGILIGEVSVGDNIYILRLTKQLIKELMNY